MLCPYFPMLMYAPQEVQTRIRNGRPAAYTGPKFGYSKGEMKTESTDAAADAAAAAADEETTDPNVDTPK